MRKKRRTYYSLRFPEENVKKTLAILEKYLGMDRNKTMFAKMYVMESMWAINSVFAAIY
jgi:hypothetical protein